MEARQCFSLSKVSLVGYSTIKMYSVQQYHACKIMLLRPSNGKRIYSAEVLQINLPTVLYGASKGAGANFNVNLQWADREKKHRR